MGIQEEWKKEIEDKIRDIDKEKIPALIQRCPKCQNLSLEFDPKTGRVRCTKCGFEVTLHMIK